MALSELQAPASTSDAQDGLRLEALGPGDVDAGLALSDAAGWNQTGDDWALFIRRGRAIGLRDASGRLVATAAALPYGKRAGWISMVLVADAWRHRGLASRMMDGCVAHLLEAGIVPVLDATPAGAVVYRRIGFVPGFEIDRWERPAAAAVAPEQPATGGADLEAMVALDRASTGLDRRFLLESFLSRAGTEVRLADDGQGFVIARAGRRATQVGPLAARDEAQAIALLGAVLASAGTASNRPVFLDVPRAHQELARWLEQQGFSRQRPFVRMSLGATEPPRLSAGMFVLAGPEFG